MSGVPFAAANGHRVGRRSLALLALLPSVTAQPAPALVAMPPVQREEMGCSSAVLGDLAVFGACGATASGFESAGLVQAISISTRETKGQAISPAPGPNRRFGSSVAMGEFRGSGIMLVGSPQEPVGNFLNAGFVFVYSFDLMHTTNASSTFEANFVMRLYNEEIRNNDHFGLSVAMHGERVIVGAPGPDFYPAGFPSVNDAGAAFVFDLATGEQLAKLQPRDASYNPMLSCYRFGLAVAIHEGIAVVGAPKAKYPCAPRTKGGAVFLFSVPADGFPLRYRDTPWWWADSGTYNQTAHLNPPTSDTDAGQVEFGRALSFATNVWNTSGPPMILVIGAPATANDMGAVFISSPFEPTSLNHEGIQLPFRRVLGPAYLGDRARYGSSLSVDQASGLMLVGAPSGYTAHGHAGVAHRTWLLRETFATPLELAIFEGNAALIADLTPAALTPSNASGVNGTANSSAVEPVVLSAPAWASLPLQDVPERTLWAPNANPGDEFGDNLVLASDGYSVIGAANLTYDDRNGTIKFSVGATFLFEPILMSPSMPPGGPPPPWRPDWGPPQMPSPPSPPPSPPSPPPDMSHIVIPVASGSGLVIVIVLVLLVLGFLKLVAPETYKKVTKICRKPPFKITEDNGRGPVGEQLRAILALQAEKTDVFAAWDKDGGGSASRKEFRTWFSRIGYDAPVDDVNELFDEFDVDGSGEIDADEFRTAFELRGELWRQFGEKQKNADEEESIYKAIADLEKKIGQRKKQLIIDEAAVKAIEDAQEETAANLALIDKELDELNADLAVHQARLDAFKSSIKTVMKKTAVVNAFKTFQTPDQAAIAIQARVRGRVERREVQAMLQSRRSSENSQKLRSEPVLEEDVEAQAQELLSTAPTDA